MDLVAFLNARQDADEQWAQDVLADQTSDLHGIARRMLREVEAKRKIMSGHERNESRLGDYCNCQVDDGMIYGKWPCPDLAAFAAVYSDHPDYDPAWT